MNPRETMTRQVRAALEREARINLHRFPIRIDSEEDVVTLEGEVADIAAKKLALELTARVEGVGGVLDRLRVAPGEKRGDGAIRDSLLRRIVEAPEFRNCTVRSHTNERSVEVQQGSDGSVGDIEVSVTDGVIVLEGGMQSVPHKLFAGVLAWWTPGCCDVLNALEVRPAYPERDDEITETLQMVLEADPLLDGRQVMPRCEKWVVTLEGSVPTEEQKRRAEMDAWFLEGVERVLNHLEVVS